jgi:spore germination cell wall hydrolase CwlJ-like protein
MSLPETPLRSRALNHRSFNLSLFLALLVFGAGWIVFAAPRHFAPLPSATLNEPADVAAMPPENLPIGSTSFASSDPAPSDPASFDPASPAFHGLTPQEAMLVNAATPFSTRPAGTAPSLILDADDAVGGRTALTCLTQAVYYEAASEPLAGERAVAQVVLNRLRSPRFPKTVCGVVYQGAAQRTGCQFTFTCDGSLARPPNPRLWTRAQGVAQQALAGSVQPAVGDALNYHADYVAPAWSQSMAKVAQIGLHIFYRVPGAQFIDPSELQEVEPPAPAIDPSTVLTQSPAVAGASEPTVRLAPAVSRAVAVAAAPSAAKLHVQPEAAPSAPRLAMRSDLGLGR